MKKLLICIMLIVMSISIGCDKVKSFIDAQTSQMTPEKALKIAEQGEEFYGKAKVAIANYIEKNPKALTEEQKVKLEVASSAFELAYKNGKSAIIKIYAIKNGQKVTLADIKDECIIIAGEYVKFKKIIQPLLKDTITYPDEVKIDNIGNEAQVKLEEVVPSIKEEAPKVESGSPATTPAIAPAGTPST